MMQVSAEKVRCLLFFKIPVTGIHALSIDWLTAYHGAITVQQTRGQSSLHVLYLGGDHKTYTTSKSHLSLFNDSGYW